MIDGGPLNAAPLNAPYGEPVPPFEDWAAGIDPITARTYFALEIDDGVLDPVRIPIGSWQATVQSGRASYAQAVIPNALQWVDAIEAREEGEFAIYRGVVAADGEVRESEMARAPLQFVRLDRGANRASITISGYAVTPSPPQVLTRTLQNVRSVSVGTGFRVRCDIDWFLRPGHMAVALGDEFEVAYINYYANTSDAYMDVGERSL